MTSIIVNQFGGPEVLEVADLPAPEPGPSQVQVRVAAAAVHPVDVFVRSGPPAFLLGDAVAPYILGWDLAGTVDQVGDDVDGFRPGDRVIGLTRWFDSHVGTYADLVVFDAAWLAPAPSSVDLTTAAALPLNGLTAAQALDLITLTPGQTLAITGAAGSLGGFAVELASRGDIRVVAVAGADDEALVRSFGATDFVARSDDTAASLRAAYPDGVDALLDTALVGAKGIGAVRDGGTFVAVTAGAPAAERGIRVETVSVASDGARLAQLGKDVDAGHLTPRVAGTYPLIRAADAHRRQAEGGIRGRLVLLP